jgi:RNA polymerase sigma factor (sigma-70 family)
MPASQMREVIQHLRRTVLLRQEAELTDGQLLERFVSRGENAPLEALVRRHAPMVWCVCRRLLRSHQDAEDAVQATFLILVKKASSVVPRQMVGNWLYGVAHQTARKARATAAKRGARERQMAQLPEIEALPHDICPDLRPLLDQELSRLPDKYRVAVVLCDLEGKSGREAARQLGCPEGTVASRLARGRSMLAKKLARHGLALSGASLAAVLAQNAAAAGMPTSTLSITIKTATLVATGQAAAVGAIPATVATLTEEMMKIMFMNKLKRAAVWMAVLCMVAVGGGLLTHHLAAGQQISADEDDRKPSQQISAGHDGKKPVIQPAGPLKAENVTKSLQGVWTTVTATKNGIERKEEKGVELEFKGDQVIIREPAHKVAFVMSVQSPSARGDIAFGFIAQQPSTGTALMFTYAIYKIEGDTLTLCIQSAYTIAEDFSDKDQVRWVLKRKGAAAKK